MGAIKFIRKIRKLLAPSISTLFNCQYESYWLGLVSLAVVVSRWFGHSRYLYDTDSALYALALNKYDVTIHQPHPPGYPLYVLLAKGFYWIVGDANLALVLVSILFSVLASLAVFYLAKKIYGRTVAWISLLLFVSAPLVWFHGQVALNYMTDAFFSTWFGIYVYSALGQDKNCQRSLIKSSLILAVGAGFRPSLFVLLLPLWLWAVIKSKRFKTIITNIAIVAGVILLWLVPSIIISGGLIKFYQAVDALLFAKSGIYDFSIFAKGLTEFVVHLKLIANNLLLNFNLIGLVVVFWLISYISPIKQELGKIKYPNLIFWSLWIIPALIFYLIVIFNLPGYLLLILPAITILVAKAIELFLCLIISVLPKYLSRSKAMFSTLCVLMVIVAVGANIFVYYRPEQVFNFNKPVYFSIKQSNLLWESLITTIRRDYNPQSTLIGINQPFVHWGFSQFQYYLPEYETYSKIFWGFYNPDNKVWFLAHNRKLLLVSQMNITTNDANLIVIQSNWDKPKLPLLTVPLDKQAGELAYYDLTDSTVRELLSQIKDIVVANE